jgi:glycosyltransferase involved in cell wall biosynthesis
MSAKPLLGYVVSHPIQYQAPLFRVLAKSKTVDFVALFGCQFGLEPSFDPAFGKAVDFGIALLEGYQFSFLPQGAHRPDVDRFWGLRFRYGRGFREPIPDVLVLHGWRTAMMWQAAVRCRLGSIPYFLRAETPAWSGPESSSASQSLQGAVKKHIRRTALRALIGQASGLLALGTANERFYSQMGASASKMVRVPYVVDNAAVASCASAGRASRCSLRAGLGIGVDDVVLVGVGKLIPRKRTLDIVDVLRRLPDNVHLVWIGSGEMEETVRSESSRLGVSQRVHLLGFLSSPDTWRMLGAADVFVCPSEAEPWGLVINEAVVAGLPVLATDQCGAAENLVLPKQTGEILPTADLAAWESALRQWSGRILAGDRGDIAAMRRLAEVHSIETAAGALESAVQRVAARPAVFDDCPSRA